MKSCQHIRPAKAALALAYWKTNEFTHAINLCKEIEAENLKPENQEQLAKAILKKARQRALLKN